MTRIKLSEQSPKKLRSRWKWLTLTRLEKILESIGWAAVITEAVIVSYFFLTHGALTP